MNAEREVRSNGSAALGDAEVTRLKREAAAAMRKASREVAKKQGDSPT